MKTQGDSDGPQSYYTDITTEYHSGPTQISTAFGEGVTQTSSIFHHILEWKEEEYPEFLRALDERAARKVYVQISLNQFIDRKEETMRRFTTLPGAGQSSHNQQIPLARAVGSVPNENWETNVQENKSSRPLPEVPGSSALSGPSFPLPPGLPHPPQWRTFRETTTSRTYVPSSHLPARDINPTNDEEKENHPCTALSRKEVTGGHPFQQLDDLITQCIPDSVAPYSFCGTASSNLDPRCKSLSDHSPEAFLATNYTMPGSFPGEHAKERVDDTLRGRLRKRVPDLGSLPFWRTLSATRSTTLPNIRPAPRTTLRSLSTSILLQKSCLHSTKQQRVL
ncbi:hypothetical protein C8Q80DRAFT_1205359 [Daedaleopsis nitida]|nr:hypothetical protein C8Q80DRAFT_1205359 [Daedaleopsis nitida]